MRKRFITFLLLGLILVGAAEYDLHKRLAQPIRKFDRFWVNFCLGNGGEKVGQPAITMVRITDDYKPLSFFGSGEQSSTGDLSRLDYGTFLHGLSQLNPKAIAFMPTPVFQPQAPGNALALSTLKDGALQVPRMTLGCAVSSVGKPENSAQEVSYPGIQVTGDPSSIPEITTTTIPADPDLLANGDPAFIVFESPDPPDFGQKPRVQLVGRQGNKVVPGFVLAAIARQNNFPPEQIAIDLESKRPTITMGDLPPIPIDSTGTMALPSHGGLSHAMFQEKTDGEGKPKRRYHFASLRLEDVAMAVINEDDQIAMTVFEELSDGKFDSLSQNLVLLGFDRSSERTIQTEDDEQLSPMTATARAIATIQSGRHTTRWPLWARCIGYGLVLVLGILILRTGRLSAILTPLAALFFFAGLVVVFRTTLAWTPLTGMVALFCLMFLLGLFCRSLKKAKIEEEDEVDAELEAT